MKVFIVLALTFIGTKASRPAEAPPPCYSGHVIGSQCVTYTDYTHTYADAAQKCETGFKGNLFEIRTEEMYDTLAEFASTIRRKMWVGAKKTAEGKWRWLSDNSSATIPNEWFAWGEPNNWGGNEECLQMKSNGKLNDADCGKSFAHACLYNFTP